MAGRIFGLFVLVPSLFGCSGSGSGDESCGAGQESADGRCVAAERRYEPPTALDHDNVVSLGEPLRELVLPEPPHSGFRLIVPPRELGPGEELSTCIAWPYPELHNRFVYAARLYTTGGLHHSNMYGMPLH